MRRLVTLAVAATLLSGALPATSPDSWAARCAKGSMDIVYRGAHRCLTPDAQKAIHRTLVRVRERGVVGARAYSEAARPHRVTAGTVRLVAAAAARGQWLLPAAPGLPAGVPMLDPGAAGAATLSATVHCSAAEPGVPFATLRWSAAREPGTEQRVIVTIFPEGFDTGVFDSSAALAADQTGMEWFRVHGHAIHLWRVLTRHGDGWRPSATARFTGPVCVFDKHSP